MRRIFRLVDFIYTRLSCLKEGHLAVVWVDENKYTYIDHRTITKKPEMTATCSCLRCQKILLAKMVVMTDDRHWAFAKAAAHIAEKHRIKTIYLPNKASTRNRSFKPPQGDEIKETIHVRI